MRQFYYKQDKPGTTWYDKIRNDRGWTIDFNMRVFDVQNDKNSLSEDNNGLGVGIYVNDGSYKETINFLTQEIILSNSKKSVIYDTTEENDYRITGKNNSINIYAKSKDDLRYNKILESPFFEKSNFLGNSYKPSSFEDINGNLHVVWVDDSYGSGVAFYSVYKDKKWSLPEKITDEKICVQSLSVIVDSKGIVWVCFESKDTDGSSIGIIYKNNIGWSLPYYEGNDSSYSKSPKMAFDSLSNICMVWEDYSDINSNIYINIFYKDTLSWGKSVNLSNSGYKSCNPSISTYLDNVFVSWTEYHNNNKQIKIAKYDFITNVLSNVHSITDSDGYPDNSYLLSNVSGNIFIVWNDNREGKFNIYGSILNLSLDKIKENILIVDNNGGSRFPVLSEQVSTGNIYIVWQDYKDVEHWTFNDFNPSEDNEIGESPLNSAIFSTIFPYEDFFVPNNSILYVKMIFPDDRDCFFPSIPIFFQEELPIVYESSLKDPMMDLNKGLFSTIKCAFYNLDTDSDEFYVSNEDYNSYRDLDVISGRDLKEIRFGDFSNVLSVNYALKNFKIYSDDAVSPFFISEGNFSSSLIDDISVNDLYVNNYGDVLSVGQCGVFYYIKKYNDFIEIVKDGRISIEDDVDTRVFKSISVNKRGDIFLAGGNEIYYSRNINNGFLKFSHSFNNVNVIEFDKNDVLFVGTKNGLKIISLKEDNNKWVIDNDLTNTYNNEELSNNFITCIEIDNNNCSWIGTENGLFRYYNGNVIKISSYHGLSSSRINDIAIRNTAIRYVATHNGINKMVGLKVDEIIDSTDGIWNNNVKSVLWRDPNVLFAGTLNRLNQILFDNNEENYVSSFYEPVRSLDGELSTYYILSDEKIKDQEIVEVYINGNKVEYGYFIGGDENNRVIKFNVELNHDDVVEAVVRKDLNIEYDFNILKYFKNKKTIRVKDFSLVSDNLYVVVEGDENEIKVNDFFTNYPYDTIHLDTTPPRFVGEDSGIKITNQIQKSLVRINIKGATDSSDIDVGSGIESMIVSNYPNFTTDGTNPALPVPFKTSLIHDLGVDLDNVTREMLFDKESGKCISYFNDVNEIYAGTSDNAKLYKYNFVDNSWDKIYSYEENSCINFIYKYNNDLLVGVSRKEKSAILYVYDFSNFVLKHSFNFDESSCLCVHELNGRVYIGTGVGEIDSNTNNLNNGGSIYFYNDGTIIDSPPFIEKIIDKLDDNVYDMTSVENVDNILLISTGDSGYIYEIDVENKVSYIIHNDSDPILSIEYVNYEDFEIIFSGLSSSGVIKRASVENKSFDVSFKTIPSSVEKIKSFPVVDKGYIAAYAAVGNVLYYFSKSGTWVWKYTHNELINDISYNDSKEDVYIISKSNITKVSKISGDKQVYLKLIDRAGNEASYPQDGFSTSISIESLVDFVSENRLLELDENGKVISYLDRENKFYSGNKIGEEKGVYVSDIFDGTGDLVKWDVMSWQAMRYSGTDVFVYVRSSNSKNEILFREWNGPYLMEQSSGIDLSSFSGRYFQFKVELISQEKGVSPSFHKASIKSINSASVHFFTTNFVLPSMIKKGIISSQKIVPVSADVVFGINTTNSVNWEDYQEVDENRLFNISQIGENLRVGIKFISPQRSMQLPYKFDEYGPYDSNLFVNTVEFSYTNNTGQDNNYHFRVTFYDDYDLTNSVFSAHSINPSGFNVNGSYVPSEGYNIPSGETVNVIFSIPGYANISCNEYYFVKIEYSYDDSFSVIDNSSSFMLSCSSIFVDDITFYFENEESSSNKYHFRIRFYENVERVDLYKTVFSGNDRNGWFVDDEEIPEDGVQVSPSQSINVTYKSNLKDFDFNKIYYLIIDVHDGDDYVYSISSYTFQIRDVVSMEYCGEYMDVPIVNNFGIFFELENKDFITLNK